MTSVDIRSNSACSNVPRSQERRRKSVLFCPVCGHESGVDGDWLVASRDDEDRFVCPECEDVVASR